MHHLSVQLDLLHQSVKLEEDISFITAKLALYKEELFIIHHLKTILSLVEITLYLLFLRWVLCP